jgi:molybdopterin-guanine dinucleotide biosynthesis protein B
MKVLGLTGWSGSGKTTLLTALLPLLIGRGLRVSTVKHAHHDFDLDQPGKDSWRHRAAGAHEVMIAGARRWALLHENPGEEPGLDELLARMSPVDLVLVEGFKSYPHPKLEVHRPALGRAPIWPGRPDIVAVASDDPLLACPLPVLPLGNPAGIAGWIADFLAQAPATPRGA